MARNSELERAVMDALYEQVKLKDPFFRAIGDEDDGFIKHLLKAHARAMVDTDYKLRLHLGQFIGYGYDFTKEDEDGTPARNIYENAVANTKDMSHHKFTETFVTSGVIDDRIGWYVTRLDR